ncbi:MAG TPA: hypothetical protein VIY51_01820 [Xanthobacteraceae bacterium]
MARRAAPTYRAALAAIQQTYLALLRISETPRLPRAVRAELQVLASTLGRLLTRDNGRSR